MTIPARCCERNAVAVYSYLSQVILIVLVNWKTNELVTAKRLGVIVCVRRSIDLANDCCTYNIACRQKDYATLTT